MGKMSDVETLLDETKKSLARMQGFDPQDLVQSEKLGQNNFKQAVKPAQRLVSLFNQLPMSTLDYIAQAELDAVKGQANSAYQLFEQILSFDVDAGDVNNRKMQLVNKVADSYQNHFTQLHPLISYSVARTADFRQLEEQGRAAVQEIRDQTDALMQAIEAQKSQANEILEGVRKAAAEQGVSQEAYHFSEEAERHKTEADFWRKWTIRMAFAVGTYGVATLFFHKFPWLTPENTYETVQFTVGKILVFFVLAYMLALCAKNFLSNRHNEIVNRHRQNALMTYKALVDAGGTPEARDAILNHAASSIYRLHETGYTRGGDKSGSSSSSIVEMLPRTSLPLNQSGG